MEKAKKILFKLLFPPLAFSLILFLLSMAFLAYVFMQENQESAISYIAYILSAYALTILCVRIPAFVRKAKNFKSRNKYLSRYFGDVNVKIKLSLYLSLGINMVYALIQGYAGVVNHSVWFHSLAAYYLLLGIMRFLLLYYFRKYQPGKQIWSEWKRYRICGYGLLFMNIVLFSIVFYIVVQNQGFQKNPILTISMAAYTFYTFITAIVNVIRYRKYQSPVISASKVINLVAALVSMLSLETSMISAFGDSNQSEFRLTITAVSGFVVCVFVLAMSIYMIIHSTVKIKRLHQGGTRNEREQ